MQLRYKFGTIRNQLPCSAYSELCTHDTTREGDPDADDERRVELLWLLEVFTRASIPEVAGGARRRQKVGGGREADKSARISKEHQQRAARLEAVLIALTAFAGMAWVAGFAMSGSLILPAWSRSSRIS